MWLGMAWKVVRDSVGEKYSLQGEEDLKDYVSW